MALTNRQTNIFAAEDWKKLYTTFSDSNFQSYDFETIRKVMVDYLKTYYAEDFNDFTESSEYIALMDLIAFTAQSLAFRTDLNARENFLETAERRDSVLKLVKQLSYNSNRNRAAQGLLKILSVNTSESVISSAGNSLDHTVIRWNDPSNPDWQQQFVQIMNAAVTTSQKIGKPYARKVIDGITVDQYNISIPSTIVPVFNYFANVADVSTPFEVVSANILENNSITEQTPGVKGRFGVLYQNDGKGFSSDQTGFFLLFKQGLLQSVDFNLTDKLPNRQVQVPIDNINNDDVWLYALDAANQISTRWTSVEGLKGSNAIYNTVAKGIRSIYTVNSGINDQIELQFSDGTFGEIPQGSFRVFFRTSNGMTYRISPSDMNNVVITIPYVSGSGRQERLTITASLQYTVANSSRRDLLDEIKAKAPQNFYTQNRMVNGEDYNIFPFTRYPDIVRSKSVNRFSAGLSRNLDINDPTGKFSSTDIFADDGALYRNEYRKNINFTFNTRNEISSVLQNQILPLIMEPSFSHYYYDKYPLLLMTDLKWQRVTSDTTSSTGFFVDGQGNKQMIGAFSGGQNKFLQRNGLIRFDAPSGYYFDTNNILVQGTPRLATDKSYMWASINNLTGNGTNEIYFAGRAIGAVTLTANIPSNAIVGACYVPLYHEFTTTTMLTLNNLIYNNVEFGLRFDYKQTANVNTDPWKIVNIADLDTTSDFSFSNAGDASKRSKDSSWLLWFSTDGNRYTVTYRGLDYTWTSQNKVRFLNVNSTKTYDTASNTFVEDQIKVLKINTLPDGSGILPRDIPIRILKNVVESDGYTDNSKVLVTFTDSNNDSIIDDPSIFTQIQTATTPSLFLEKFYDFDNLIRYSLLTAGTVNNTFSTKTQIEYQKNNFPVNQIFYAQSEMKFYRLTSVNGVKTLVDSTNYIGYPGRQDLYFQYTHNADDTRRIDPAISNLIDMYILTRSYDDAYRIYINDNTGTIAKPTPPTGFVLQNDLYPDLFNFKMLTDGILMESGVYKSILGSRSDPSLRARLQVIKGLGTTISDNELKSMIVTSINEYFAITNWDFGETFYFSELSAYLHQQLGSDLGSVILIPYDNNSTFGSLYEIRCQPNEIFISSATVDDIEIVTGVLTGINSSGTTTTVVSKGTTY